MERVETAEIPLDRERSGALCEGLVDLDDAERRPFIPDRLGSGEPGREPNCSDGLDIVSTCE